MMQQYFSIKEQYKDSILFFRLGDFYEMFYDDAITASRVLELTLTARDSGNGERAPMCGVPYHASDTYIDKLITNGYTVAICEQISDPATSKGLVMRDVIRVVTPGTVMEGGTLDSKQNNYLCCIFRNLNGTGLAFVDISTGELLVTEFSKESENYILLNELVRHSPSEIILSPDDYYNSSYVSIIKKRTSAMITEGAAKYYEADFANSMILKQFGNDCLVDRPLAGFAVGAILAYIEKTQKSSLPHITNIKFYSEEQFVDIDYSTHRNLEITSSMRTARKRGSLLWVLDKTNTAMGGRKLKNWVVKPLVSCAEIERRLNAVEEFANHTIERAELRKTLSCVHDMERLVSKTITATANPRDVFALANSMAQLPAVYDQLKNFKSSKMKSYIENFDNLEDLNDLILRAIQENPPISPREGGIIRDGFNEQVDYHRKAIVDGSQWIADLEKEEREKTGIKTLKIGFNRITGYYIEVTKTNLRSVPDTYTRKQTLSNCERYITGHLKELENAILGAQERNYQLEYSLFCDLRNNIAANNARILMMAQLIAEIDVLSSLAEIAVENSYVKPSINMGANILIKDGRHPVVEAMSKETLFVPNDTTMTSEERLLVITGPNMAGKSTYMRQVALIVLMAQIGSFVPASSATIGIVDKIFTRVGASDDLASGQSTFMIEMHEVANILDNATPKSLLILDEIGRGTSTYDGLSIAWAVVEYIANKKKLGAKTIFATHYHELTELEDKVDGVVNYCISAKKRGDDIVFLRKIIRGGADDSYGIEVALLAGVKRDVITRAKDIVAKLEDAAINKSDIVPVKSKYKPKETLPQMDTLGSSIIIEELRKIDATTITPIEAMNILYSLKQEVDKL